MALTALVKDELSRLQVTKPCCRKAEVAAMLRFAGGLHIVSGRIVVEAELDTGNAARRLRRDITEVFGHASDVIVVAAGRPAPRQPLRGAGGAGRRVAGPADRPARPPRAPGPGAAPPGRLRRDVRRRGRLARRLPGARLADRAGPLVGARGDLPRPGGRAGPGRRGPPAGHPGQGARGARHRPGRDPGRRRDRRAAHPARRPRRRAGLGGAPDAARGPGHRQPAGQLRRRQPAPLGAGRGRGRRPGRAGPGDPRRGRSPTTCRRPARCGWSTSRPASRSSASWPTRR